MLKVYARAIKRFKVESELTLLSMPVPSRAHRIVDVDVIAVNDLDYLYGTGFRQKIGDDIPDIRISPKSGDFALFLTPKEAKVLMAALDKAIKYERD